MASARPSSGLAEEYAAGARAITARAPTTGYFFSDDPNAVPSTHSLVAMSRIELRQSLPEHLMEERRELMLGMGRASRIDEAMERVGQRSNIESQQIPARPGPAHWPPLTSEDFAAARAAAFAAGD